jgi:site-specific recombinase XerD
LRLSDLEPFHVYDWIDRNHIWKVGFNICPYAIRHTFATDVIVRGVDLQTIATLMGHVDLGIEEDLTANNISDGQQES